MARGKTMNHTLQRFQCPKDNTVINDDCLYYAEHLPKDAFIITDPPYNQGYHYNQYDDNMALNEYKHMFITLFAGRKTVMIHYPETIINEFGLHLLGICQEVVSWVYNSNTAKQSRLIVWWNCKPDFRLTPQPYKNPTDKRIAKRIAEGKTARGYDWWNINQVKNVSKTDNPHPCPIPYEVAEKIILSTTKPGDLVIDPFCGSGTVLIAAKKNGRRYIGFDIDKKYCDYAERKLSEVMPNDRRTTN